MIAIWGAWVAIAAATWATNARIPLRDLYAVDEAGVRAGAGRAVVLLGWPVAFVAIALVAFALDILLATQRSPLGRRAAIIVAAVSVALCATVFVPGVIQPKHLDARVVNAPAAVGVGLAFAFSAWSSLAPRAAPARSHRRSRQNALLALVVGVLMVAAIPWLLANLGVYAGDVPGIRDLFMSKQVIPEAGHPHLRAVHLGNHDGFDGLLLAFTCALLIRHLDVLHRLRAVARAYLALCLVYGAAVATADWWTEQVVKRGWTSHRIPSLTEPSLSAAWAAIVVVSALVWLALRRRREPRPLSPGC